MKTQPIKYALNTTLVGKMPKNATKAEWRRFNSSFNRKSGTAHSLAVDIWRGYSFTPLFKNNRRRKVNFEAAFHLALDFDTMCEKSSLDTLKDAPFSMYASFAYSTPSSKPDKPRSRLVFIFEQPIVSREKYELLYRALLEQYPAADRSPKDAARLFYGSRKCDLIPIWSIMDHVTIDNIIGLYKYEQSLKQKERNSRKPQMFKISAESADEKSVERLVQRLLDKVVSAPQGEKHSTLVKMSYVFGGYVAGGYFSQSDAEAWLQNAVLEMNGVEDVDAAYRSIATSVRDGMARPLEMKSRFKYEPKRREVTRI